MKFFKKLLAEPIRREPYDPKALLHCERCGQALYITDIDYDGEELFSLHRDGRYLEYSCKRESCARTTEPSFDYRGQVIPGRVFYRKCLVNEGAISPTDGTFESRAIILLGKLYGKDKRDASEDWKAEWSALVEEQRLAQKR